MLCNSPDRWERDGTRAPPQPHLTKRVVFKSSIRIQTTWQLWLASGQLGWKDYPFEKYAMLDWLPQVFSHLAYIDTRELPGVALVNISNGQIFTGKGNTDLKWNIEVAHIEEKNNWMRQNFLWNSMLASAKDFSYSFHLEWMSLTFGVITQRQRHKSKN